MDKKVEVTEDQLLDIYINGFCSGAYSALCTLNQRATDWEHNFAHALGRLAYDDPLGREEIRKQVEEALAGRDSGPVVWTVPVQPE